MARPARYGRGEETLLDPRVRDTWEVPLERVAIDRKPWNRTLLPVLDELRADLRLPEGSRLAAELHSMLVYAPGQFFRPHQDSEKAPTGLHEARPVTDGYRIVLTYNLRLQGEGGAEAGARAAGDASPETVEDLAQDLRAHFETPLPPRWSFQKDDPPRDPPSRLVYLLHHEYTERARPSPGRLVHPPAGRLRVRALPGARRLSGRPGPPGARVAPEQGEAQARP